MKKILAFCIMFMFILSSVVSAEIKKDVNTFTGNIDVFSIVSKPCNNLSYITLVKDISENSYQLKAGNYTYNSLALANKPVEIKIDQYPIYKLILGGYAKREYGNESAVNIVSNIPKKLIDNIKDSKRVSFGSSYNYV